MSLRKYPAFFIIGLLASVFVTRSPFSKVENGVETGFSLDLWAALMADMARSSSVERAEQFDDMLAVVENGAADAAIANISIAVAREAAFDFSQPILLAIALCFGVLLAVGCWCGGLSAGRVDILTCQPKRLRSPLFGGRLIWL